MASPAWHWQGRDLVLDLQVQPRAASDAWCGEHGSALRLRITAPPVDGKANDHLQRWLAKEFGVKRLAVELLSGHKGRRKRFLVRSPQRLPGFMDES